MEQNKPRGKRYSEESKLNYAKILAVVVAVVVVVMFVAAIKLLLSYDITKPRAKKEYFPVYSENKWGVINSLGETVISPSYAEMIVIPDSTQDVFLCVYDINTEDGSYKTKALNSKNKEIFTEYEQVEALENYDSNQNIWYEENVLKVKQNGKIGLINLKGKQVLNCEYDDIYTLKGVKNSLIAEKNGKLGLVDDTGRVIIEAIYTDIDALGTATLDGYIIKNETGSYGVIGANKEQKLDFKYEKIEKIVGNNLFVVTENAKQKLINSKGTKILDSGFDEIKQILKDSSGIIFVKDGLYGVMTTDGTVTIPNTYQELKQLDNGYIIAKNNDKYGVIDTQNNVKLYFNYTNISYNSTLDIYIADDSDLRTSVIDKKFEIKLIGILSELNSELKYIKMRIEDEYKYYNLNFEEKSNTEVLRGNTLFLSKKDGKYGYVDKSGNVIVDYKYDDATEQNSKGFAAVKQNGVWGSINKAGVISQEPSINLDNSIYIDFIGTWHLSDSGLYYEK